MRFRKLGFVAAALLLLTCPLRAAEVASADDTALFLAGMSIPAGTPLAPLSATGAWKRHANVLDAAFDRVEKAQLSKIRVWSQENLTVRQPTLFYMFSGPDFLYASAFFPDAKTYVLSGLEPVGSIPDLTKLPPAAMPRVLGSLQVSMSSLLRVSFFKTLDMRSDLRASPVNGTLPVLYVFLVRSGKIIQDVSLVRLDANGDAQPELKPGVGGTQGVKITFMAPGGPLQTLYYFSANVANGSFKSNGFEAFCDKLGQGDAMVKSASYLLYGGGFSQVRSFLLQHSAAILEDDTGIPVTQFDASWQLRPFGRYSGPISLFAGFYQPALAQLFRKDRRDPLDFGVGYRYRPNETSLLLAVKREKPAAVSKSGDSKTP